jgi:F0F1-type ATP synthase delta subunit
LKDRQHPDRFKDCLLLVGHAQYLERVQETMATIYYTIIDRLIAELASKKPLSPNQVETLRALLKSGTKLRSDDLIKIFSSDEGDVA